MNLPDVSLGELYGLLGEKDVQIYRLQRSYEELERMNKSLQETLEVMRKEKEDGGLEQS